MSFWTEQSDGREESPAATSNTRSFWLGGTEPGGSGSEDEVDSAQYGLFSGTGNGSNHDTYLANDNVESSVLGLTSMDFWSTSMANESNAGFRAPQVKQEEQELDFMQYPHARQDGLAQHPTAPDTATSPDAMVFEDLVAADSFGPSTSNLTSDAFYNSGRNIAETIDDSSHNNTNARIAPSEGNIDISIPSTFHLNQTSPSSIYGTPLFSPSGVALHDLMGGSALNGSLHAGALADRNGIHGTSVSPNSILQQLSSSTSNSDPNSGSSRSSSANPPASALIAARMAKQESLSSEGEQQQQGGSDHSFTSPHAYSTSSAHSHATARSPPHSTSGLSKSKSSTSVASSSNIKISSTNSSTPRETPASTSTINIPDKASQMQACETSAVIRSVIRDESIKGSNPSQCQLLVLGLPEEGARSRVETQVKIGLVLVRPKSYRQMGKMPEGTLPPRAMNYKDAKGGVTLEADQYFEKVGTWKYLSLPTVSSVKRKAKKHHKSGIPPEHTLFADIKVVSATSPSKEIFVCQNCQQREEKRLQRKTQNRSKPSQDIDSGGEDERAMSQADLAKRKIVLFNCGKYLEFTNGEVVIPTRITCYCRHHKEKYGFVIVYTLTDHLNNVVANAASAAIFLTDDHKARPTKPDSVDLKQIPSLATVANGPHGSQSARSSAWNSAASSVASSAASSAASSQVNSAASSANPSRNNSFDNLEELGQQSANSSTAGSQPHRAKRDRSAKPYNLEDRPSKPKRTNSINRLNSFAMTPLHMSAPGSPRLTGPSPMLNNMSAPPQDGASMRQSEEPPQDFAELLNHSFLNANSRSEGDTHPSPGSSLSAPSTPGVSLESFNFYPNTAAFGQGSMTSLSDDVSSAGYRSVEQSPAYGGFIPLPGGLSGQTNTLSNHLAALDVLDSTMQAPMPKISRLIPSEGPVHGGIEVIILGENFTQGLEVTFGDTAAVSTQTWGSGTLMCVLPPSPSPGPVVVGFKNLQLPMSHNAGLQLFTYLDTSDKALMELALQVVGMKMTGRINDARDVARRIIAGNNSTGDSNNGQQQSSSPRMGSGTYMQAGAQMSKSSLALHNQLLSLGEAGQPKDLQAVVMKLLSLLDVDDTELDTSVEDELRENPINHRNEFQHSLLHLATLLGFHKLVSFLVERDAELDSVDKHGYTALHLAALRGRVAVTRVLLEAGAAIYIRNKAGQTSLEIARERDQVDVEALYPKKMRSRKSSHVNLPASAAPLTARARTPSTPILSPTPIKKRMFSLSSLEDSSDDDDDGDSDWSGDDEEAHFASESDLESRLSRHASSVSIVRSQAQSPPNGLADTSHEAAEDVFRFDPASESERPAHSFFLAPQSEPSWLSRHLPNLKLPNPTGLATWRKPSLAEPLPSSSSSGAISSSVASTSSSSSPSNPDSGAEEPHFWPTPSLFGYSAGSKTTPEKSGVKASLSRRLGYPLDNLTEDALRSYSYHAQKYNSLRKDKMLYFFWLPLFFIAIVWVFFQASNVINSTLLSMQRITAPLARDLKV